MAVVRFSEGDVFRVPLRSDACAIGLVARRNARRPVLVGFFFRCDNEAEPFGRLQQRGMTASSDDAILVARFADHCLKDGDWPIIGRLDSWDRSDWPVPPFLNEDVLVPGRASLVAYSDDDPMTAIRIQRVVLPQPGYELDGSLGTGAVEFMLTKRLEDPSFRR